MGLYWDGFLVHKSKIINVEKHFINSKSSLNDAPDIEALNKIDIILITLLTLSLTVLFHYFFISTFSRFHTWINPTVYSFHFCPKLVSAATETDVESQAVHSFYKFHFQLQLGISASWQSEISLVNFLYYYPQKLCLYLPCFHQTSDSIVPAPDSLEMTWPLFHKGNKNNQIEIPQMLTPDLHINSSFSPHLLW